MYQPTYYSSIHSQTLKITVEIYITCN